MIPTTPRLAPIEQDEWNDEQKELLGKQAIRGNTNAGSPNEVEACQLSVADVSYIVLYTAGYCLDPNVRSQQYLVPKRASLASTRTQLVSP